MKEREYSLNFRQTTIVTQNSNPTRLRTVIKNFNNYPGQHMEMIEEPSALWNLHLNKALSDSWELES